MTNLNKEKRLEYESSLKAYRDLSVILDESFDKGKIEGIQKGKTILLQEKIIKFLEKKLGEIPKELEKKINLCSDINILDNILDSIFEIENFDQVNKILE
ncbi:MAG: hypothetical protein U0457_15870 [Candidatus Sericytochromatia bacterium]